MAPRRDGERDTPVFLAKTYRMVEEGRSELVGWAADGASFAIVDCERFTEEVIPSYFKHKNFSSFIRQLNFYGFRKVKDPRPRGQAKDKARPQRWEFQHPSFRRGRKHLLKEIRRRSYQDASHAAPDKGDVEKLKDELAALQRKMATLTGSMEHLVGAVRSLQGVPPEGVKPEGGEAGGSGVTMPAIKPDPGAAPTLVRVKPEAGTETGTEAGVMAQETQAQAGAEKSAASAAAVPAPAAAPAAAPRSSLWVPGPAVPDFEAVEAELNEFYDEDFFDEDLQHQLQIESPGLCRIASLDAALGCFQAMDDDEARAVREDVEATMMADPVPLTRLDSALGPLGGLPATLSEDAMEIQPPAPASPMLSPPRRAARSTPHPKPTLRRRLENLSLQEQQLLVERMANLILQQSGLEGEAGRSLRATEAAAVQASGAQAPNVEESISLRLPCGLQDVREGGSGSSGFRRMPVDMGRILPVSAGTREEKGRG